MKTYDELIAEERAKQQPQVPKIDNSYESLLDNARRQQRTQAAPGQSVVKLTPQEQQKPAQTQQPAQPEGDEEPKIAYKDLYTNPENLSLVKQHLKTIGKYEDGLSDEEAAKKFMSDWRWVDNNTASLLSRMNRLVSEDPKTAMEIGKAYLLFDRVADAYKSEGQPGVRPWLEGVAATVADPANLIPGAIGGKLAARAGTKTAVKKLSMEAAKNFAKKAGVVAAIDAPVGAAQDIEQQKFEFRAKKAAGALPQNAEFEVDKTRTGVVSAISVLGSAVGAVGASKATPKGATLTKKMAEAPALPKSPTAPLAPVEKAVFDEVNANMDEVVSKYSKEQGRDILNDLGGGIISNETVKKNLSAAAVRVATRVMQLDPSFMPKESQKVSDAISRVFTSIREDKIDDVVLEDAIRQSGLTVDEFAKANLTTVSEAGSVLQQYSVVAKMMKKMGELDPEFKKKFDDAYGAPTPYEGLVSRGVDGFRQLERESKAWITSGIDTTMRNLYGSTIGLTVNTGVNFLESFTMTTGKVLGAAVRGKFDDAAANAKSYRNLMQDSFDTLYYMKNKGLSDDLSQKLLSANPSLANRLTGIQDVADGDVSRIARWAQTFNVAQDTFLRRAHFASSVDKQLRDLGMPSVFTILKEGKEVPKDILVRAVDDAMKATFSYMPNRTAGLKKDQVVNTIDNVTERGAATLISAIEKIPGGSFVIPFPRFMANALAFQYRYSPLGAMSSAGDFARAALAKTDAERELLTRQAARKGIQSTIGIGAIAAAYQYRNENSDVQWFEYKNADGSVTDMRSIFPVAPYLAVAEFIRRAEEGFPTIGKEMLETIAGMKIPGGTQGTILDQIAAAADSEQAADNVSKTIGTLVGDFAGRFTEPFVIKQVKDFFDVFTGQGVIARDSKAAGVDDDALIDAAWNKFQTKIPGVKEELPAAAPRGRDVDPNEKIDGKLTRGEVEERHGEWLARIVGVRNKYAGNDVIQEVNRLGLDSYKLFGAPTGNKEVDNEIVRVANKAAVPAARALINSETFDAQSTKEQRLALENTVRQAMNNAKTTVIDTDFKRKKKMEFSKLPLVQRNLINDYHKASTGKTLEEDDAYEMLDGYVTRMRARTGQ